MTIELPEIADYLTGVSTALADLDADERDDLLADVHAHLVDVAREGGSLVARLGPPDAYAAELRAAAGLPAPEATVRPSLGTRLERTVARLTANDLAVRALETARTLAPVWWVARGYVAAVVLSRLVDGDGWSTTHPWVPHLHGSGSLGLLSVAALVLASIWLGLGRARDPRLRATVVLANIALLAIAVPLAGRINDGFHRPVASALDDAFWRGYNNGLANMTQPSAGLVNHGMPVHNIYPYSRDGKLLLDVLLYDEYGRPIDFGSRDESNRRYLTSPAGQQLLNSVPLRYIEPDGNVLHPHAGPRITVPSIVTPSLTPTVALRTRAFRPTPRQPAPDPAPTG